jgi:CspA family cold shock protein
LAECCRKATVGLQPKAAAARSAKLTFAGPAAPPSRTRHIRHQPDANRKLREDLGLKTGFVKWFNARKGYGFLHPTDGGFYVYVHISALERAGIVELKEGQKINFDIVSDQRTGKVFADNLRVLADGRAKIRVGAREPAPRPTAPFIGRLMGQLASRLGTRRET